MSLRAAHGNCPTSLAGGSLASQAHLPCVEPAVYLLRTVLRLPRFCPWGKGQMDRADVVGLDDSARDCDNRAISIQRLDSARLT